jgi:hypothetical protein
MKRVRVMAGAVGLAPLTLALTPGIAHAAGSPAGTKSVRGYGTIATVPRVIPDVGAGCDGSVYHKTTATPYYSQSMWFWSKRTAVPNVCIGTVEDDEYLEHGTGHELRVRIWSKYNASHQREAFHRLYPGTIHSWGISAIAGVHQEFGTAAYPWVEVCTAWVPSGQSGAKPSVAPLCYSVYY